MVLDSADSQVKVEISRNKLSYLRDQIRDILQQDWKRFTNVNRVIRDYLRLLNTIPLESGLVDVDLGLLKDLEAKLDIEFTKAKVNYYIRQFSFLYAHRKRAMLLQELDRHEIPDDLRELMKSKLTKLTEDWNGTLNFTNFMEDLLKKQAEKDAEDVQHLIQRINSEPIDVENTDLVKSQFMSYSEEIYDASREMEDNLSIYTQAPLMCQTVKKLVQFFKATSSSMLRDDMNVDEESQGIPLPMPSDDGAWELPSEQERDDGPNLKRTRH